MPAQKQNQTESPKADNKNSHKTLHGLTSAEARKRLIEHGKNILVEEKKSSYLLDFLREFKNPLVLILMAAAGISFAFGESIDGGIIIIMIFCSTILNFYQEKKAGNAAKKLKEQLKTQCTVIRDGQKKDIHIEEVVPGDLIFLNAGDLVPADAQIIEAKDFFVNQSSLTGESFPVEKTFLPANLPSGASLSELTNIVFSGTNVVTGTATATVIKTGRETEFGKISHNLAKREEQTEFTIGINKFSGLIMRATLIIVIAILFLNVLLKKDLIESFLFALAVAVGLTPELLPMILSINMSAGSMKMAEKGVIVKKLVAIPNFGSMDVLCTDKTGTLTEDRIVLVKYTDISGHDSEEVLLHAYLNSYFETGIVNPMDEAVKKYRHLDISGYTKIDEIPFDFLRKRMSVVVEKIHSPKHATPSLNPGEPDRILICKGAPEEIFKVCTHYYQNPKQHNDNDPGADLSAALPFSGEIPKQAQQVYENLSRDGYRVLAISCKKIGNTRHVYEPEDENELTLLGFIAFLDPPKTDARQIVEELEKAGVNIKIITGDNELVTRRICNELDIPVNGILLGHEIDGMTDDALRVAVEKNTIFARFSPDEKNRIIHALRQNGHVVGYMGDGINDAPSLKNADVGISVANAVDVAKESADFILTQKDLQVLYDGILEGRKTFGNSMKYIMMGVSSNFGNMFSVIGAVIFLPFLPMLPIQILFNNLLYDFSQITIPGDNVDREYIEKPKRWNMPFIRKYMLIFGLISSLFDFATFYLLFSIFKVPEAMFQTGWFIESLATQTLIIHIIRTRKTPFLQSNAAAGLTATTIGAVIIGWLIPYTPIGTFFGFAPLNTSILLWIATLVITYLITVEIGKKLFYKYVQSY